MLEIHFCTCSNFQQKWLLSLINIDLFTYLALIIRQHLCDNNKMWRLMLQNLVLHYLVFHFPLLHFKTFAVVQFMVTSNKTTVKALLQTGFPWDLKHEKMINWSSTKVYISINPQGFMSDIFLSFCLLQFSWLTIQCKTFHNEIYLIGSLSVRLYFPNFVNLCGLMNIIK